MAAACRRGMSLLALACALLSAQAQTWPWLDGFGWNVMKQHGWRFDAALSDEFNQAPDQFLAPDPAKWATVHPTGWKGSSRSPFDSRLAYTFKGNLVLEMRHGATPDDDYPSGIASSLAPMGLGYYEARAQASPKKVSSAFWFFDKVMGSSYEIDVFEFIPLSDWHDTHLGTNIHHFVWNGHSNVDQLPGYNDPKLIPDGARTTQWGTYGVLREPGGLHFYVNGHRVRSIWRSSVADQDWPGDKELRVIFSTGIYDWQWGGQCNCPPEFGKAIFKVDYFRVWN